MINVEEALRRANQQWSVDTSHVDVETAFQDRTVLAGEVIKLRQELADTEEEMRDADHEIENLMQQINRMTEEQP